jgi:hypothetical protein
MSLQNQENRTELRRVRLWHEGCNIQKRHRKLPEMEQNSLSDKFSPDSTVRSPKEDLMKRNLIGILSLVMMSAMINVTANAQTVVKADVPFAFKVGTTQLPAGTYEIKEPSIAAVMIQNRDSRATALSNARHELARNSGAKLVFHCLAGQYFLAEIWRNAGESGRVIPTSKQEKDLRKELLARGQSTASEEVLIALN